jgi:DMSO/TMAO reductase YedYZ heme-binding membrane subunit
MPPHLTQYFIMVPIMAWVVWRRVSRSFGRQPIKRKTMIARIAIFAVVGVLLALSGLQKIELAEGLAGGVVLGAALGLLGVRLTRFEVDPVRGDCYVPNPWIGAFLTVLLLGRLAYRFIVVMPQVQQAHAALQAQGAPDAGAQAWSSGYNSSPLTMLVIGLLLGYYILYFTGLLVHHRRFQQARPGTTIA